MAKDLDDLTNSVRERGVRQPIRVRYMVDDGMYQVIAGERRLRAARAAGLAAIPCLIEDARRGLDPLGILVEQIVENWQRADLQPVELSNALLEMRDKHGLSQEQIAKQIGESSAEISKLVAIQKVDAVILAEAVGDKSGRFNRRKLVALASIPPDEQRQVAKRIREWMTTSHIEAEVQ